eukprot:7354931-Lingulodinium_polyedra.AAC.1
MNTRGARSRRVQMRLKTVPKRAHGCQCTSTRGASNCGEMRGMRRHVRSHVQPLHRQSAHFATQKNL